MLTNSYAPEIRLHLSYNNNVMPHYSFIIIYQPLFGSRILDPLKWIKSLKRLSTTLPYYTFRQRFTHI